MSFCSVLTKCLLETFFMESADIYSLFDVKKLQQLQDEFSDVTGVASWITDVNGEPITTPSRMSRLCCDFIQIQGQGYEQCFMMNKHLVLDKKDSISMDRCQRTGLWEAGIGIFLDDEHVGSWMIGQVRVPNGDNPKLKGIANDFGFDLEEITQAYTEIPEMDKEQFRGIAELLKVFVTMLTDYARKSIKLLESNTELKQLYESLPDIIWKGEFDLQDGSFCNTYISEVADEILLLDKGTLNHDFGKFFERILPEYMDAVMANIKEGALNPGETYSYSYQMKRGDGTIGWFETTGRSYHNHGKIEAFGITKDITRQKSAVADYNAFFEQFINLNLVASLEGVILSANKAWERILGFGAEELIGTKFFDLVHPEDIPSTTKEMEKLGAGVVTFYFENRYRHKNGQYRRLAWSATLNKENNCVYASANDVTEKVDMEAEIKTAKEKAEASNFQLEYALKTTHDGIWDWNLTTNEMYYSPRWKEILGYQDDELANEFSVWENLTKPEDVALSWEMLQKHIAGEIPIFDIVFQMKHKNGSWRDIHSRAQAIHDHNGKAIRVIGTHLDITESIIAKKEIELSETRFRELIKHSPNGIAVYKPVDDGVDFEFVDFNKKAEDITRASREEIIGCSLLEKFPNMDKTPLLNALREVYHTGSEVHIQPFFYKDEQREGWRENYIYKLPNGEIVVVFQDVTEFKNQEEELVRKNQELEEAIIKAESNEYRFKALHNASFGGIAIHDKGLILDCNEGLSKITGYSHEELIGMDGLLLIAEESRNMVLTNIEDQYEKSYEAKGVRKDGTVYPVRLEGRMIPYKGKTVRVVEFRDTTERNRIIQELVNAKEKAIQSDRLKSAFLTNMSHEIRTPMNGILGFIDILNTPGLTDNERMEFTATIKKSSNRLLDTINDIITFSQIEAGDVTITEEEIELREVLKSHARFFTPEISEKGLEMIIENYLPEDKSRILTDKVKLDSVLTNLIKNAIKFTNSGQIIVGVREKDGKLEYFVKDTGIGIPKDKHELIFDRFTQADMGISRGHEGSGLGLAICRGYVKNLGGKIWVESEENRGSTFKFTTKYKKAEPHKIIEESNIPKENMLEIKQKSDIPVMLIAEDDETSYELLLMILGKGNYRFLYAANGVEAVDIYMNNPGIDIILMDLKMPEMDGLEATRRIREMDKQIPIIAQTAFAFDADIKTAYEAGCTDYVTKPIRRHEILEKIDNCLKG